MTRRIMIWALGVIGALVGLGLLALAVQGEDFFLYQVFAPRREAVRRQTFEQSRAYREGMQQELQSMAFQYAQAAPEHRAALASVILHRVADYDVSLLDPQLQRFVSDLRSDRLGGGR